MFFGFGGAFVLGLAGGCLVAFCELEAGGVKLGFQVAVVVEPDDGVGDGLLLGSAEGSVAVGMVGVVGAGKVEEGAPGGCVAPSVVGVGVEGLEVGLQADATGFGEGGGGGRA